MSTGHIITRGYIGGTMVTCGYGQNTFTAVIVREVLRLSSRIAELMELLSPVQLEEL